MRHLSLAARHRSLPLLLAIPLIALIAAGGYIGWRAWSGPRAASDPAVPPRSPEIELRWGIRITQVGVTADGGMVDFRYQVIDPDKALAMNQDLNNIPVLTDEASGTLINSAALMAPKHDLRPGQTYFLLYRNTDGAIKRGNPVTVKVGDLLLEHLVAR
jgi:hypothetical protein